MSALVYMGDKTGTKATALAAQSNVDQKKSQALTEAQVDSRIQTKLANYPTSDYADQQDALRATREYVDAQDALRVALTDKNQPNGPIGLDANGKVPLARIPTAYRTYQRGPRAYYSPSAYQTSNFGTNSTVQTLLYQCSIADPGWAYKILVFGYNEAIANDANNAYAIYNVRVGSSTGQIIARGFGPWRPDWGAAHIMPDMTVGQSARTGATTLNVYGYRGGGSSGATFSSFLQHMCVMLIPA